MLKEPVKSLTLSEAMVRHRKAENWSLRHMAEMLEISASTLSRLERGIGDISWQTWRKIADYFAGPSVWNERELIEAIDWETNFLGVER